MKKHMTLTILMALAVLLLAGCGSSATKSQNKTDEAVYHKITAEEAYSMMEEGNVTIVDVRRPDEYAQGHIEGAILVTNETIGSERPGALPDTDATLLIYCRSGRRSREASMKLLELGYRNVYDFGGINDWPYGTVRN